MALQGSGQISLGDIEQLVTGSRGYSPSFSVDLLWVQNNTKDGVHDLGGVYGRNYYQRNVDGNCNSNPIPTPAPNSGNKQCTNCSNVALTTLNGGVPNCDAKNWLQADCNCNCTYNCTQAADQTYNCDCNCNCNCFWSDDQLKVKKTNIPNALGKVNNLNGFYYQGNALARQLGLQTEMDVGVSAQDVYKTLPEALGERMGEYQTVRYERLVPLLVEAIKELNNKVESLTKKD
jgi:hypothetical protein